MLGFESEIPGYTILTNFHNGEYFTEAKTSEGISLIENVYQPTQSRRQAIRNHINLKDNLPPIFPDEASQGVSFEGYEGLPI